MYSVCTRPQIQTPAPKQTKNILSYQEKKLCFTLNIFYSDRKLNYHRTKRKKKKTENKRKESTSSISQDQRKFTLLMGASK
jgi:hypothetical protein